MFLWSLFVWIVLELKVNAWQKLNPWKKFDKHFIINSGLSLWGVWSGFNTKKNALALRNKTWRDVFWNVEFRNWYSIRLFGGIFVVVWEPPQLRLTLHQICVTIVGAMQRTNPSQFKQECTIYDRDRLLLGDEENLISMKMKVFSSFFCRFEWKLKRLYKHGK